MSAALSVVGSKPSYAPGSPEWVAQRKTYIGASDSAAVMGLSQYKTPYRLWLEKTGRVEPEDISQKPAVIAGNLLEPVVGQWYTMQTGRRLARVNSVLRHPDYDFIATNLDYRVIGEKRNVECKTTSERAAYASGEWGEAGTNQIPSAYLVQCMHEMIVTGYRVCDLAVLIGGGDFRVYTINYDGELAAQIIAGCVDFWRHVTEDIEPPMTAESDARARFPRSFDVVREATPAIVEAVGDIENFASTIAKCEAEIEQRKIIVMQHLGEADTLYFCGEKIATWKSTKPRSTFDSARFRAENPDLYAAYVSLGEPTRPFRIARVK